MECEFRFYMYHLFKRFLDPINIQQITFEVRIETYAGLKPKCQLYLSNFIQNWREFINVLRTRNIKLREDSYSSVRVGPCGQTNTQTQQS
jgi:hypothetical protein